MKQDFKNITYLEHGNKKQQQAYQILVTLNIMTILKNYDPILVGTIPIEIDVNQSDLDIICDVLSFETFKQVLTFYYGNYPQFKITDTKNQVTVNFFVDDIEIEIYGENKKTSLQNGYRHMIIEHRLLTLANEAFKKDMICLKQNGMKTEPAFAHLLKLEGDPYEAVLQLETLSDSTLKKLLKTYAS